MSDQNKMLRNKHRAHGFLLGTAIAASIALAHSSDQALAGAYETVTDSGQILTFPHEAGFDSSAAFGGSDRTDAHREGAYAIGDLADDDLEAMLGLEPMLSPGDEAHDAYNVDGVKETLLGPDTRTRNYTTEYPTRAVVLIEFEGGRCTGFMIAEDTVATAGHCVHPGDGSDFYPITSYRLHPGFDANKAPFGTCGARQLLTVTNWAVDGDPNADFAAIKLDCTIGSQTGWFGLRTGAGKNEAAIVTGYPGDKPLEQWQASDVVRRAESRKLFYAADTVGGNSGGPVWHDWDDAGLSQGPYVIAIHTNGVADPGLPNTYNSGVRITNDVLDLLIEWIDLP